MKDESPTCVQVGDVAGDVSRQKKAKKEKSGKVKTGRTPLLNLPPGRGEKERGDLPYQLACPPMQVYVFGRRAI